MDFIKDLEQLIEEDIKQGAFPGANYALVLKDKVYLGSLGNKRLIPYIEKNSLDTIYDMASLTKVVATTSCIMKLLEKGQIRLFSKVSTYLEDFRYPNMTIWHLMTHTSGLPEGLKGVTNYRSEEEVMKAIYQTDTIDEPATHIRYSDLNFILLGKIVEKITKMRLNEFAKTYIFDPLEMKDTRFLPTDIQRCAPTEERHDVILDGVVCGHVHDETAYLLHGVSGNAGLFSTVSDIAHFMQMILNDGMYQNKRIFEKITIDRLFKVEVEEANGVMKADNVRGLGWMVAGSAGPNGELTSPKTIHHTGFTGTSIWIDKENEIGFCLLSNRVHPTRKNTLHIDARAKLANFIMSHYQYLRKEEK